MGCEEEEGQLTFPTVHLNGSSGRELLDRIRATRCALYNALVDLQLTAPHGRDYYLQGDEALPAAMREHESRRERLASVTKELETIEDHLAGVLDRRADRRAASERS